MTQLYDKETYQAFLSKADLTAIPKRMEEQAKLINVKVPADSIKTPEKWPELERFMKDKEGIMTQRQTATKATQLPMIHPVMRATLIALEGAGVINQSNQQALFDTVAKMVDDEIYLELDKLEKKMRDDKFKLLYGDEVKRRILIEKAHNTYKELSAKKDEDLTEDEAMLIDECQCVILLDGDLEPLNTIYDEIHKSKKS